MQKEHQKEPEKEKIKKQKKTKTHKKGIRKRINTPDFPFYFLLF